MAPFRYRGSRHGTQDRLPRRPGRPAREQHRAVGQRGRRQRRGPGPAHPAFRQRELGAVRETREESGIDCEITGLSGIYTDPGHVLLYTSNGEARQEFSIVLTARATGGQPTPSSETSEVRWVAQDDLKTYQMDPSMRLRVQHYAEHRDRPYIG